MARGEFQWQNCEFLRTTRSFFLSRHDEIEKSDSINFVWFLHDGQCVSNYHSVFFIISFTRIFISNYLRHSLLIWQNKTSLCFREIPLFICGGLWVSRSLAPLHCFAFRTYTVGNIRIPKIQKNSHTRLYCVFTKKFPHRGSMRLTILRRF